MGLKGPSRLPNLNTDPRLRRLANKLRKPNPDFISTDEVISLTPAGQFKVDLATDGGLENLAGELKILLGSNPGLTLTGGLAILLDPAGEDLLTLGASGLNVDEGELYSFVSYYGG
jgi:hypothetical protein